MREPKALIGTEQLAAALGQPNLRIYDCTSYLEPAPPGSDDPYLVVPGRRTFEEAHIPGADFLDLQGEFSDATTRLRFMMAPLAQLEAAFARHGLGGGTRVVLYSIGTMMWATRFWWIAQGPRLRRRGGAQRRLRRLKAEGRPTESGPARGYPPGDFSAAPRPGFFVDKQHVLAATKAADSVIVNALGPQFHQGLEPSRYGRPGRIPGSMNVPAATLVDERKKFVALSDAETAFSTQGVGKDKRVICYCGGGISATIDLFLLHQLGYQNLTLYDGSMGEWAKDPSLPIETD